MKIIEKDYQSSLVCTIEADIQPIEVVFRASSRNNTFIQLIHEPTQTWEEVDWCYALKNGRYHAVLSWIMSLSTFSTLQIEKILDGIRKCMQKCESRYGSPVSDYDEVEYDAKLIIGRLKNGTN